jgi:hypothetical protein
MPRHSRTSRVLAFNEIGGAGFCASLASERGAGTAAGSLEAAFESSDVQRFVWILMEFRRRR